MSDCKPLQITHAVVIYEDPLSEHQWTANPKVLCVGQNDTITFYTISAHKPTKEYVIEPVEKGFFNCASISIGRNAQKDATINAKKGAESEINFNSIPTTKIADPFVPILKIVVRH